MGRTNIFIDDKLIQEAMRRAGKGTKREVVHLALENFVRRERQLELLKLRGKVKWEGNLQKLRERRTFR